jgi:hypothetical protein
MVEFRKGLIAKVEFISGWELASSRKFSKSGEIARPAYQEHSLKFELTIS